VQERLSKSEINQPLNSMLNLFPTLDFGGHSLTQVVRYMW
jgi:hypothetical protein